MFYIIEKIHSLINKMDIKVKLLILIILLLYIKVKTTSCIKKFWAVSYILSINQKESEERIMKNIEKTVIKEDMEDMLNTEFIGFKVNKIKKQKLNEYSKRMGITRSAILNIAINEWFEEVEKKNK